MPDDKDSYEQYVRQIQELQNDAFHAGIEYALREVRRIYKTTEDFNKLVGWLRRQDFHDVPLKPYEPTA